MGLRQRKRLLRRRRAVAEQTRKRRRTAVATGAAFVGVAGLVGGSVTAPGQARVTALPGPVELVQEVAPGPDGLTDESSLVAWQDSVLFTAAGPGGVRLWQADAEGVDPLFEDPPFDVSTLGAGEPQPVHPVGDQIYFTADRADSPGTQALWVSDGTDAGTTMLAEREDDYYDSLVIIGDVGGTLFFGAAEGDIGYDRSLWSTDGTVDNTTEVAPLTSGAVYMDRSAVIGDKLIFKTSGYDEYGSLWVTDGTANGTRTILRSVGYDPDVGDEALAHGRLYFSAHVERSGRELWRTNGTEQGTRLVANLAQGARDADPTSVMKVRGDVVLQARRPNRVVRTNGTEKGTTVLRALPKGARPTQLPGASLGKVGVFAVQQGSVRQLWRTNGTKKGTQPLTSFTKRDVADGFGGVSSDDFVVASGLVWFTARTQAHGVELWASDGTKAGTGMVRDLNAGPAGSSPTTLASGGRVWFVADDGQRGRETWRSVTPVAGAKVASKAKQKQPAKVTKRVKVTARVKTAEVATAVVRGKVKVRGGKAFVLAERTLQLEAGRVEQVTMRLAQGDRQALKAVKRFRNGKGRQVRARLNVVLKTDSGAQSARKVVVQLR